MYCDYYSIINRNESITEFVDMLVKEINLRSIDFNHDWEFDTIFFGGGTPSLLSPKHFDIILNTLSNNLNISKVKEITIEINPNDTSIDNLIHYLNLGINRASIGFQSLQTNLLKFLTRNHKPEDCKSTYYDIRNAGYENVNIDMLFNIPGQTPKNWENDLRTITDLKPDHISAYSLIVEHNTPLYNQVNKKQIQMPHNEVSINMFESCQKFLNSHSFNQYEISNYAKKNKECMHNKHYWLLDPYLAFGPSAHGFDGKIRSWNVSSLDKYINSLKQNHLPVKGKEVLTKIDQYNEIIINGLRTTSGISFEKLTSTNVDMTNFNIVIEKWKNNLSISNQSILLDPHSYIHADEIAMDMMIN